MRPASPSPSSTSSSQAALPSLLLAAATTTAPLTASSATASGSSTKAAPSSSVDGDGSARAVVGDSLDDDAVAAEHRVAGALVVRGRHLGGADRASLDASDGTSLALTPTAVTGDSMRLPLVDLPASMSSSLLTLTLLSAAGAAHADVFLLQGERGPAPAFRSVVVDAGADCGAGEARVEFGVDEDGDGSLDDDEVDGASVVCNGAGFACANGVCSVDGDVVVSGSLDVATSAAPSTSKPAASSPEPSPPSESASPDAPSRRRCRRGRRR